MKIRLDRTMYTRAQRTADAQKKTFSRWAFAIVGRYGNTTEKPMHELEKLTRSNSVSAAILTPKGLELTATRIRECIALALEYQNKLDRFWPHRYDRSSLEAVIQLEALLGRSCDYQKAEAYIDKRIEQRKEEIRVAEKAKRRK